MSENKEETVNKDIMKHKNEETIYKVKNPKTIDNQVKSSERENIDKRTNESKNDNDNKRKKCTCFQKILISISIIILTCIIVVVPLVILKPWKNKVENPGNNDTEIHNYEKKLNYEDYKKQLKFKTKEKDIRRLLINQTSFEDMVIDGIQVQIKLLRKTKYDIYIISEKDAEDNQNSYNKIYTASIAIVSQCLTAENDDCELKELVNLSKNTKTNSRRLTELNDLKDIPIALCLYNFTDTNIIISISCPESLSDNIKNEILSDLYYFRPYAKVSQDKIDEMRIKVENNITKLSKKSQGLCDIENKKNSFCDSDTNIIKNSEGDLLSYEEILFTNITNNINNGFLKNKKTKLVDETSNTNLNSDKYKEILDDLLLQLNPYMKYEDNNDVRRLDGDNNIYNKYFLKGESLFYKEIYGAKISLNLKIDSGLNVEAMKCMLNLQFDNKDNELKNFMEFTNLNKIIKQLIKLSNAGNNLAYELYENINNNLNNLTQEITIKISNLNSLIIYKDLTEIFDSSLSLNSLKILPFDIIEESNKLFNKLNTLSNEILDESSEFQNYSNLFNYELNEYLQENYNLMNNTYNNLNQLKELLKSPKSIYTEISTYYSNNTPTSYIKPIQEVKNIYLNYNQTKYKILNNSIEILLKDFEDNYLESINKPKKIISNLYTKLQNDSITIENANEEDYETIKNNLFNSNNYDNIISNKIKENIKNIFNTETNNFKLSEDEDIKFNKLINESLDIGNKLDYDQIIDKIFDKIMSNFKDNITNILKYMDKIAEQKLPLVDDVLKENVFTKNYKEKMKNKIRECGVNIIKNVKSENDDYMDSIKNTVNEFINENLGDLNSLILDLNILLSEESLKELSYFFEYEFYSSLNSVLNTMDNIISLVVDYYTAYNTSLAKALSNIKDRNEFTVLSYVKTINKTYFDNHDIFIKNINKLRNYINNDLQNDFLDDYKNIIVKVKQILLKIKNNKISEIYPGIRQFDFYKKHTNNLDELNNKIDKYFSLDLFYKDYVPVLNNFTVNRTEKTFNNLNTFINAQHNIISKYGILKEDKNLKNPYYFCINMTCTGKYAYYTYCEYYNLDKYIHEDNYSIYVYNNRRSRDRFENVSGTIDEKVNLYNSKISIIKSNLLSLENEIINKNMTSGYLSPIQNEINLILSEKFGENLIKNAYNYYQNNIGGKVETIFNDIDNKWNQTFNLLEDEINDNFDEFKYSIKEFGIVALLYENVYSNNISKQYFNSIVNLQKNELNHTISYYYNYLLQLINSTYLYIINNIPTNEMMLNTIINLRTNEIIEHFNKIINNIIRSKNDLLNINNQINILQTEENNFFKINNILNNHVDLISNYLKNQSEQIYEIDNNKFNDQYSITSKLYLENSEFGKQLILLYEDIKDKTFIDLNHVKFKETINDNWIFDQDDIIKRLNTSLFNSNKEIYKEFLEVKKNYTTILDKVINKYFDKENIIERINILYDNGTNSFNTTSNNIFKKNVYGLLDRIYEHFYNESKRINTTLVSYNSNFTRINNTVKGYKERIFNEVKTIYENILKEFKQNMINNVYKEYIEKGLNNYIVESKLYTQNLKKYNLLNSTYNLGEILDNIIEELVNEYKEIVKAQIEYRHQMTLRNTFILDEFEEFLDYEIEMEYSILLFPILKKKAIYNPGDTGYYEYDLSDAIKNDINAYFTNNMTNVRNVFLLIKGSNYEVDLSRYKTQQSVIVNGIATNIEKNVWEPLSFSGVNAQISEIENYFEKFIESEKAYENNYINENLINIIKYNFNKSLDNIILSFGNDFFERYFKYNEYFKIKDLYNNLKYSLEQTIKYYITENYEFNEINTELPKELKNKLFNLNDMESLIIKNKNNLLELFNEKINDFINNSKDDLINKYITFMGSEAMISMSFDDNIIQILNNLLNSVKPDIQDEYINILNYYLNEKFIYSYYNILNDETTNLINMINDCKNQLNLEMDDLFVLESENILEDINIQINNTLESINDYNLYNFILPEEFITYLNNFGKNNIKPMYEEFKKKVDEISNDQIITNFEKNANNYEKSFNLNEFITNSNTTYLNIKENYVDNMIYYTNNYYSNFLTNYEKEIYKENTEINDKHIDVTFPKLLKNVENMKIFIQTLKEFNEYDKFILKNINNVNIAYKESQKILDDNKDEENYNHFNDKLSYLKDLSLNYYNKINESYYNIREYLNKSIQDINEDINKCINITYETLINEYKKLQENEKPVNKEESKNEESFSDNYLFTIEDAYYNIESKLTDIEYYSKFNLELIFENNDYKNPKIVASIINKSKPKNINLDISSAEGFCSKGIIIDANINEAIYQMNITFDTKSTYANVTTITNFDKYDYNTEIYEMKQDSEPICFTIAYIEFCIPARCDNKNTLSNEKLTFDKKESIEKYFVKY